jgi:L-ascorbate metabolism protein UlaG (beta-lactamase superfamily)
MEIQLIRNATMRFRYGSASILTDPLLAPKLTMKSYTGKSLNPLVNLPISIEKILSDAEFVLLSHTHSDHFDATAQQIIPKNMPIYCQPTDVKRLEELAFTNIRPNQTELRHDDIRIVRTEGSHGQGDVLREMGTVSGFILSSPSQPTVYWVGDSVLYDTIYRTIDRYKPDVIITHSSGAIWGVNKDLIVMDSAQTIEVCKYAPSSTVIAVHMEALDHGTVTRDELAKARGNASIQPTRLLIPRDGETLVLENVE